MEPVPPPTAPPPAHVQPSLSSTVEAQQDGKADFTITPPDQVQIGSRTLKADLQTDRVKLSENGKVVVKVKRKDNGFEVEDADGKRVLRVKSKGGGELKFSDGQDHLLFRTSGSTPPITLLNDSGASLGKLDATSYTDASGKVRATLKGGDPNRVDAAYALPLTSLKPEERAAVVYFLLNGAP